MGLEIQSALVDAVDPIEKRRKVFHDKRIWTNLIPPPGPIGCWLTQLLARIGGCSGRPSGRTSSPQLAPSVPHGVWRYIYNQRR
jgi:hypothetical protein